MSSYVVFETVIVALVGLVSAYQVIKLLMPRTADGFRASIANALMRAPGGMRLQALATSSPEPGPARGCAVACGGGCHGCAIAARTDSPLADQQQSSR
jgi:hypothetical protein